jgi:hypothetical protein
MFFSLKNIYIFTNITVSTTLPVSRVYVFTLLQKNMPEKGEIFSEILQVSRHGKYDDRELK